MANYQHVLCATDLSARAPRLVAHAVDLSRRYEAPISFLHVIEETDWGARSAIERQPHEADAPIIEGPRRQLAELCIQHGVPDAPTYVVMAGSAGAQIRHVAGEIGADLIIVGTRGRHGLSLLLGASTPDQVLRGARCDVLAVFLE